MKSDVGKKLQAIADNNKCYCPCHKTRWHLGVAKGNGKYKRTIEGMAIAYSKGSRVGPANEGKPNKPRYRRRDEWKAREDGDGR